MPVLVWRKNTITRRKSERLSSLKERDTRRVLKEGFKRWTAQREKGLVMETRLGTTTLAEAVVLTT